MSLALSPIQAIPPADDAFRQLVEASPDVMLMLSPNGRCRHVSAASLSLLGTQAAGLVGAKLRELVLEEDRPAIAELFHTLDSGVSSATACFRMPCAGGDWVWVEAHARQLPGAAGTVVALRDVTARKQDEIVLTEANELLRRRSTLDAVTGLPNRGHFTATVERELRRAAREEASVSLLAIGFDEMRPFNARYGRDAGDLALREVAEAVEAALCRPGDQVGRLAGAMLGAVLAHTEMAGAMAVADRVRRAVTELKLEHAGVPTGQVSVTVGVASVHSRGTCEMLLREAIGDLQVARAATGPCLVA